jgi:hypothetical protein
VIAEYDCRPTLPAKSLAMVGVPADEGLPLVNDWEFALGKVLALLRLDVSTRLIGEYRLER